MPNVKSIVYRRPATKKRYKGVELDSFLEFKWAKFFDACEIEWSRPTKHVNYWLPDFAIKFQGKMYYIEVKPLKAGRSAPPGDLRVKLIAASEYQSLEPIIVGLTPHAAYLGWSARTGAKALHLPKARQIWKIMMRSIS